MIHIRQATLADKPAIFKFLTIAYAEKSQYKCPERWEWQFEINPFNEKGKLPIWIALDENGAVFGQFCMMYEPVKIGTEIFQLAWGVDYFTLPEIRGKGYGYQLLAKNVEDHDIFASLNMSDAARYLVEKLGCIAINSVSVLSYPLRANRKSIYETVKSRLDTKGLSKLFSGIFHYLFIDQITAVLINSGLWIRKIWYHKRIDCKLVIKQIQEFDHCFDNLWESLSKKFYAIIKRDSTYLNWKYVQQPHMDYKLFSAEKNGNMCGYIILRLAKPPESNTGIIADLFVDPDDQITIQSLLSFAKRFFRAHKVNTIMAASSIPAYKDALEDLGFKKFKDMRPMFKSKIDSPTIDLALKSGSWFFGRSDHDWDQFPYIE